MLTADLYTPAKLIMIDLDEIRLKTAKELGATHVFKSDDDVVKNVMELTGGVGVDTVIEAVGIPATFRLCQDIVAPGGTIANLGVHGKAVPLHLEDLWDKSISASFPPILLHIASLTWNIYSDHHPSHRRNYHTNIAQISRSWEARHQQTSHAYLRLYESKRGIRDIRCCVRT